MRKPHPRRKEVKGVVGTPRKRLRARAARHPEIEGRLDWIGPCPPQPFEIIDFPIDSLPSFWFSKGVSPLLGFILYCPVWVVKQEYEKIKT